MNETVQLLQAVQTAWLVHARHTFPREAWDGDRSHTWTLIQTKEDYISFLMKCQENLSPAHTSLYPSMIPESGFAQPFADSIIFEVDGPLERNYADMRRLYAFLKLRYNSEPRIYFSGNRSFHVFADFMPIVKDEPLAVLFEFAKQAGKALGMEFDWQMYTSPRKLSRVPYTIHEKSARVCVPVLPFWSLQEIITESSRPQTYTPLTIRTSGKLEEALLGLNVKPRPKSHKKAEGKGGPSTGWIENLLGRPLGDGRHRVLWHVLAPYLVSVKGLPVAKAEAVLLEYFLKCDKVRPLQPSAYSFKRLIRYYLKLAERDGYPPWRLQTIERLDPQLFLTLKEAGVISNQDEVEKDG